VNDAAVTAAECILVIKLGALGDVVQALGPMAAIRRHHARAHITVLTTAQFAPLLSASPYVDETWIDPRPRAWQLGAWLSLRQKLRGARFVRVYDLQTSGRSSFYSRLFGPGRRPEWSGIATGSSHPHANPQRDFMHTIERQAEQLHDAGIAEVPPTDVSWLKADVERYALPRRFALLVPGGSAARLQKRWSAASYGELAARLLARDITPVVIGVASERPLAASIRAVCPEARDLTGQTSFAEIAALARQAQAAIGNDTGPMHLIAAAGCPCVVLFSAESDPALCAPRGTVTVLRRPNIAELTVDEVAAAVPSSA
jgi:ADP-heptose:LPS heptosyltransferase